MRDLCRLIGWMVVDLIRSRATLEAEIWTLRQQINVLRRRDRAKGWLMAAGPRGRDQTARASAEREAANYLHEAVRHFDTGGGEIWKPARAGNAMIWQQI